LNAHGSKEVCHNWRNQQCREVWPSDIQEPEKLLSEGKKVILKLSFADGKPKYELKVS